MAAVGPGCADVWTQIGVTTSTHRILLGRSPLNVIFMSIKISPRSATPWPRKKRDEQYIPFLLCSGHLFVIFLGSSSAEDIHHPMLQQIIFMTKFPTDNELSSVLCIVSCCGHCPDTSQWRGGPICTVCSCCTALQYLLSIYSLATHKTFASHYPGSRGEMIGSWSQSDSCCPLHQPEVS